MRLTKAERAARKDSFQNLSPAGKADYIWSYYKLPILLGLVALYLFSSAVYRQLTKKEILLYSAYANVSVGEELEEQLTGGFVSASGANPKKTAVDLYSGLYLSNDSTIENHEYAYASKLKVMAAIEAKQLDVILMNREAYDILSQVGYLMDFNSLLSADDPLYPLLTPHLATNTVILEDNAIEYQLNEADSYQAVTQEVANGLELSAFPLFQEAGFRDAVYLGVLPNSPRLPAVMQYIEYLTAAPGTEVPAAN